MDGDALDRDRKKGPVMAVQILKASEDYLETMLMMQTKHGYVRSVDVAEHLGVTKPSVTYATKRLRENGYITMDKEGFKSRTSRILFSSSIDKSSSRTLLAGILKRTKG